MEKSSIVKVASKLPEINSRLSNLDQGQYLLSIRRSTKSGKIYLLKVTTEAAGEGWSTTPIQTFSNYDVLLSYLNAFCDGLIFAGLECLQVV